MTDRQVTAIHVNSAPRRIENHAQAAKSLGDAEYVAYVIVQGARLVIALLAKRWTFLG